MFSSPERLSVFMIVSPWPHLGSGPPDISDRNHYLVPIVRQSLMEALRTKTCCLLSRRGIGIGNDGFFWIPNRSSLKFWNRYRPRTVSCEMCVEFAPLNGQ